MSGSPPAAEPIGLDLSGIRLRVAGLDHTLARRLRDDWSAFVAEPSDDPLLDIRVEFVERPYGAAAYRPKAMRSTLSVEAAHFGMPEGEVHVAPSGIARLSLVAGLGDLAYFTLQNLIRAGLAWLLPTRGGGLLHAAGLVLGERAFLLVGAEGAGKSTWARLGAAAGARVVSDDLVLVDRAGARYEVLGTPFRSTHVARYGPGRWPLAAMLFARHGAPPALREVPSLVSRARLLANLPFVAEALETDPRIGELVRDLALAVPCAELTFAPDAGFVELLRSWPGRRGSPG